MTRFTASVLDLSRLDPGSLFAPLSFETIRADRIADLKSRLLAAGWDYGDLDTLETEPGALLQTTAGFRELLNRQAIQDAELSVLLAFASGLMLDRLGDLHATARQALVDNPRPYATNPEDWESDARYRARIQLAPEAFPAAGTPGGYIYHVMAASPLIADCGVTVLYRGTPQVQVELTVLGVDDILPDAVLAAATKAVLADNVKLLTDTVILRPAVPVPYKVTATLGLLPGPDPASVSASVTTAVSATAAKYRRLAGGLPASAITAALQQPLVDSVDAMSPIAGVQTTRWQFPQFTGLTLSTVVKNV